MQQRISSKTEAESIAIRYSKPGSGFSTLLSLHVVAFAAVALFLAVRDRSLFLGGVGLLLLPMGVAMVRVSFAHLFDSPPLTLTGEGILYRHSWEPREEMIPWSTVRGARLKSARMKTAPCPSSTSR